MKAVPASRYVVFFAIAMAGCAVDLATKRWMFDWLHMPGGATHWVWPDVVGFQTSLNEGALFGMGQGMWLVFAALSFIAAVAILYWLFCAGAARDWLLTVALACITAGIFGNLYDRLGLPGLRWHMAYHGHRPGDAVHAVRDWILVMIGSYPWPTFNVADSLLVCGGALLAWHAFWAPSKGAASGDQGRGIGD
jgi:signal peptidase II